MTSTGKQLRHIVLFKFKADANAEFFKMLEDEFRTMATVKIPQVKSYEWGTDVSKENLNHGYTHCFVLTFNSEEDRNIYVEHKAHLDFVALVKPHMEAVTMVVFWAQN
jgi:Stress responsive A/B Barrel Domain